MMNNKYWRLNKKNITIDQNSKNTPSNNQKQNNNIPSKNTATRAAPQDLVSKVKRLELIIEISKQFSSTLNVNKLMHTILNKVTDVLQAEACSFWMKNKDTNETVCHVAVGPAKDKITGMRLKAGMGIVGWVIENKEKTVVFDASKDSRFFNKVDKETNFVTKSMLCVPLVVGDECVGALSLLNKKTKTGQFNQTDLEMLESLAMSGAIAIKNAQLFQSERQIKELQALLDISKEITSTLNLDRVLISIVNLGSQVIHFKRAVIGLLDDNNKIILSAESNVPKPDMDSAQNKQLLNIMNYVMSSQKPLHITNYKSGTVIKSAPEIALKYLNEFKLRCISLMILIDSEGKLGIISMEGTYTSLVVKESEYVMKIIINNATVAIRNAQLYHNIPGSNLGDKFKSGFKLYKKFWKKIFLLLLLMALAVSFIGYIPVPYNLLGEVEIVPQHTTQVSSLTDGVAKQILFKEGQKVTKNQTLMILDESLLRLEKSKLIKDKEILLGDLRKLGSDGEPFEVHKKRLELEKLKEETTIIDKQLQSTKILATSNGLIMTQNPEEMLDKQIVKGEVIAKIAQNDIKRGKILLDEKEVLEVKIDYPANISLQAIPSMVIKGSLSFIANSKVAEDDPEAEMTNDEPAYVVYFKSKVLNEIPSIRYGMTGIAKIYVGKKTLYNIYLKPLVMRIKTQFNMLFLK